MYKLWSGSVIHNFLVILSHDTEIYALVQRTNHYEGKICMKGRLQPLILHETFLDLNKPSEKLSLLSPVENFKDPPLTRTPHYILEGKKKKCQAGLRNPNT